jgi:hypothetical protein
MWQYAGDAERRDLGEPDQRVEMTAARPSPIRTAEPRTPGVRIHANRQWRGLRAQCVRFVRNGSTAKENACSG